MQRKRVKKKGRNTKVVDTNQRMQTEYSQLSSLFNTGYFGYRGNDSTTGVLDYRISPALLQTVVTSPVPFRMIETIKNLLFKHGWKIGGRKQKSNYYTQFIKDLGFDNLKEDIFYSLIGASGGNALLFIRKSQETFSVENTSYNNLELVLEPFIAEGIQRVKVFGDRNQRKIQKYEILDSKNSQKVITTISPDSCLHLGLSRPDGDYMFYTSPAIVAARALKLKLEMFISTETSFANGMNFNKLISPDFSLAKDVNMLDALVTQFSKWTQELEATRGLENRNKDIVSRVPVSVQKIGASNLDLDAINFIIACDKEISASFGVAVSNLGFTESTNYSTSEQNRENLTELSIESLKIYFKKILENLLSLVFADYDSEQEPVFFGYDPSEEDLTIREQNTRIFNNFITAEKALPGVFDIEDHILENLGLKRKAVVDPNTVAIDTKNTISPVDNPQNANNQNNRSATPDIKSKENITKNNQEFFVSDFLLSDSFLKIQSKIKKALTKQIYAEN
jgi:hypothetical protein